MTPGGVREHDMDAGGVRLRVAEAGEGRAVVLVHGNFASRRWWYEQLAAPPPGLRLIAPDLPNFAASDALSGPIDLDGYGEALVLLCDALELDRALLVGHSLGAAVVERAASNRPELASGLLLVNGPPPEGLPRPEEHYALLASFIGRREALEAALDPMCPTRKPAFWDALVDDALAMRPEAFEGNARALGDVELDPAPDSFRAPVWVLHGGLDGLVTREMARETVRHWPGARPVLWDDVGHSPQLEAPERFTRLLAEFTEEAAM